MNQDPVGSPYLKKNPGNRVAGQANPIQISNFAPRWVHGSGFTCALPGLGLLIKLSCKQKLAAGDTSENAPRDTVLRTRVTQGLHEKGGK